MNNFILYKKKRENSYFVWILIPTIISTLNLVTFFSAYYSFSISPIFILLLTISVFFIPKYQIGIVGKSYCIFIVVFLIIGSFPLINKPITENLFYYYRGHLYGILLFYFIYNMTRNLIVNNELKKLVRLITNLLFIGSIFTIIFYFLNIDVQYKGNVNLGKVDYDEYSTFERSGGLYVNPNSAGLASLYTVLFSLYNIVSFSNKLSRGFVVTIVGLVSGILTFSKTFIISLLILLVCWGSLHLYHNKYLNHTSRKKTKQIFLLFTMSLLSLIFFISYNNLVANLSDGQLERLNVLSNFTNNKQVENEDLTTGRNLLFGIALAKVDNPILGIGLRSMFEIEGSSKLLGSDFDQGVHNLFILLYGESGILGLVMFVIFVLKYFKKAYRITLVDFRIFSIVFMIISLFYFNTSHNVLQDFFVIYFLGFVIAFVDEKVFNEPF
jgi:hypothetical protein